MFRLRLGSSHKAVVAPRTKKELIYEIQKEVDNQQTGSPDLTYIDTHYIEDMDHLFADRGVVGQDSYGFGKLNPDISNWDVSNVRTANFMFEYNKTFKGDLSKWRFPKLELAHYMFKESDFDGDISRWMMTASSLRIADWMFAFSKFNGDISKWNLSNCTDLTMMFLDCPNTKTDPNLWTLNKKCRTYRIFDGCPLGEEWGINGEKVKRV